MNAIKGLVRWKTEANMMHRQRSVITWLVVFTSVFIVTACSSQVGFLATIDLTSTPTFEPTRFAAIIYGKLADEEEIGRAHV